MTRLTYEVTSYSAQRYPPRFKRLKSALLYIAKRREDEDSSAPGPEGVAWVVWAVRGTRRRKVAMFRSYIGTAEEWTEQTAERMELNG